MMLLSPSPVSSQWPVTGERGPAHSERPHKESGVQEQGGGDAARYAAQIQKIETRHASAALRSGFGRKQATLGCEEFYLGTSPGSYYSALLS